MAASRRIEVARSLSEDQLDEAINEAQKADETRLVRRLCFVKNLYLGDTTSMAARRVGVSRHTGDRWLAGWNDESVDGLRPSFAGRPPAKLSPDQFEEFFTLLKEGQPSTPQEIDHLLWDRYGVTYDRAHLARILRADGMQYAKPRPMDPRQSPDAEAEFRERLGSDLRNVWIVEEYSCFCGAKNRTTAASSLSLSLTNIHFLRRPLRGAHERH